MSLGKPSEKPIGDSGEALAAKFLRQEGLRILAVNYWTKAGEIDIVAKEGDTLVFVEVKTRSTTHVARPEQAVTKKKQRTINRVAEQYMRNNGLLHKVKARFDIVSIARNEQGELKVENHFRRAFDAPRKSY